MLKRTSSSSFALGVASLVAFSLAACGGSDSAAVNNGTGDGDGGTTGADGSSGGDGSTSGGDGGTTGGDGSTSGGDSGGNGDGSTSSGKIKKVFVILMENHSWSDIKGS